MPSLPRLRANGPAEGNALRRRIVAAAALAPPVLLAVVFGPPWSDLLLLALAGGMAWEWGRMCGGGRPFGRAEAALTAAAPLVLLLGMLGGFAAAAVGMAAAGVALILVCLRLPYRDAQVTWLLLGLLYVAVPLLLLRWLRGDDAEGRDLVLWLLLIIWAADSGGYLFGKTLGGPKLMPRVSPKKTWAGLVGGMLMAAVVGALMSAWMGLGSAAGMAFLAVALAVIGQAGDLLESGVKRHFGVKDASHLIPGHGGLLDRVDALMAATIAMAGLKLLGAFVQ